MSVSFRSGIERLKESIRETPDFPQPGVLFRDMSPVLSDGQLFRLAVTLFTDRYQRRNLDKIAAIDARGFILAGAVANVLGIGMVPIRKKGKLPPPCIEASYTLEYGTNTLTMYEHAIRPGERVVLIDDVLATGGTAAAAAKLLTQSQATVVEAAFLMEISPLGGREQLKDFPVYSAIVY